MGATIRDARCGAAHLALSGDSSILDLRCRRCGVAALAPPPGGAFSCGAATRGSGLRLPQPSYCEYDQNCRSDGCDGDQAGDFPPKGVP